MNMQEKVEAAERLLNEVKEEMAKTAEVKSWPQEGDEYWAPSSRGDAKAYRFSSDHIDKSYFEMGLAFKTKEEALAEIEARKVVYELKQQPGCERFVVGKKRWTFAMNLADNEVFTDSWANACNLQDSVWFESREAAQAAIEAVGKDRILKAARWWAMGEV